MTKRDDDTSQPKKSNVPHVIVSRSRLRTLRKSSVRTYRSPLTTTLTQTRIPHSNSAPITPFSNLRVDTPPSTDSQSDPNYPYRLRRLDTAQTNTDPPAFQATRASAGAASRLSVCTGSQRGLRIELPPHRAWGKRPPTIAENEEDFELDEVDAEVSKKIGS